MIRPAEAFQFQRVRAAGEGWPLRRKGEGLKAGRRCSWGRGPGERNGGAGPPGTAGVRGPCGLRGGVPLVLRPQLPHWAASCWIPV